MNALKFTFSTILLSALFLGCSPPKGTDANTTYFRKFDLFKLSGIDTIPSTIKNRKNLEFVEVSYRDGVPSLIIYHLETREVALELQDTFKFQGRTIYVYYTGNLFGGKPGRQREYSLHYIDNGYKLYIDRSDTLLVKSYDNIDTKSSNSYHYMIDVYAASQKHATTYSLLQENTKSSTLDDSLYIYWNKELQTTKPTVISSLDFFPPKK